MRLPVWKPVWMPRARNDERGSAVVELVWLGILLLFPLTYLVFTLFQVQGGAFAADTAARSAARAYALAPNDAAGTVAARAAAKQAFVDQGLDNVTPTVRVSCTPAGISCHSGTAVITVRVSSFVRLPLAPDVFGDTPPRVDVSSSHTVPIGQYQEITGASE